jgi:hypothetical protein
VKNNFQIGFFYYKNGNLSNRSNSRGSVLNEYAVKRASQE